MYHLRQSVLKEFVELCFSLRLYSYLFLQIKSITSANYPTTTTTIMEKIHSRPPIGCQYVEAKNNRLQYSADLEVDVSLNDCSEQVVQPVNGINNEGPFQFNIEPIRDTVLAMDKLVMYMRAEVVDSKGLTLEPLSDICCTNFLLNTMWKSVECRVNGHPINLSASQHTAYKSLMQAYVTVDANSAANLLPSLYTPESSDTSSTSMFPIKNTSTALRSKYLNLGNGDFEMVGPVTGVDFLLSDAYLAPFNSLSLTFTRQEDEFIFNTPKIVPPTDEELEEIFKTEKTKLAEYKGELNTLKDTNETRKGQNLDPIKLDEIADLEGKIEELEGQIERSTEFLRKRPQLKPKLKIKEFCIFARRIELTHSAIKSYFEPQGIQRYLGALTEVHAHALVTGISRKNITVYSNGVVPKQIMVGMVLTEAAVGDYHHNPFDFQHFGLNRIALKVNAIRVPQEPLQPDFENKHYMREYVHMLSNTGKWRTEVGNSITPENFARGCTLMCFDLTPDACSSYHTHAGKEGVVELELGWSKNLDEQITVFIFTCKDQIITLDPNNMGAPTFNAF